MYFAVHLHGNTSKRNKMTRKFPIRNTLSRKRALGRPGTHGDGLEQRLLVLLPELGSDLPQVHLTAGNYDPGHHLLLRTFALCVERQSVKGGKKELRREPAVPPLPWLPPRTFMASLSLLAK